MNMKMNAFLCAVIVALVTNGLSCRGPAGGGSPTGLEVPDGTGGDVAVLDLTGNMVEEKSLGDIFAPKVITLRSFLDRLQKAARDSNIGTVVLRVGSFGTGWAQVQEVRAAMDRIKRSGKKVVVHLDDPNNLTYFLALSGDVIQVSPGSFLWLIGLRSEVIFLKGLMDKLGLQADMAQVGRYKGAAEPLTREGMSRDLRTSLSDLLDGFFSELTGGISRARNLDEKTVKKLIDAAPHSPEDALRANLIDNRVDFRESVRKLAGENRILWNYGKKKRAGSWSDLLELLQPETTGKPPDEPHVAVVYAVGTIVYGGGRGGAFATDETIASHDMEKTLDEIAGNKDVTAVVIRINSPGGSALASDIIWQAVKRLARQKPVIVSMGDVAASGGYYIASAGTKIFAQPMTLTGSIGVMGGKITTGGLFEKIGLTREVIARGERADIFAPDKTFSPGEKAVLKKFMTSVYDKFLARVAEGRKMDLARVRRAAEGRVWTGRKADELGLVDELGGLSAAVAEARKAGNLPVDAKTAVYPRPKSWLELLQSSLSPDGVTAAINDVLPEAGVFMRAAPFYGDPGLADKFKRMLLAMKLFARERALTFMPFDIGIN